MFCEKCGKELPEIAKFCDKCGHPVRVAETVAAESPKTVEAEAPKADPQPAAAAPKVNPTPQAPVSPVQAPMQGAPIFPNAFMPPKAPISVGGWIGRSLIPCIPIVGAIIYFIMLFIWAGDKTKEESFNNWAKAQLWVMLIAVVLVVIVAVIIGVLAASVANSLF